MRLADGFVSRHHPDAMLEYKGKDKIEELHEGMPPEVERFMGKPLSEKSLLDLAKHDRLDLIYVDRQLPETDVIITRSRARKRDEARAYEMAELLNEGQ